MSLIDLVIAEGAHEATVALPFPPLVFALIAAVVFLALGFVVWSFRDAANRHSHKTTRSTGHATDHH